HRAEVLGQHGVAAVRHPVFPVITRLQAGRNDFQVAAALEGVGAAHDRPLRNRVTLPAWIYSRRRLELRRPRRIERRVAVVESAFGHWWTEMQEARLRAEIGFDLQGAVVLPGDMQVR